MSDKLINKTGQRLKQEHDLETAGNKLKIQGIQSKRAELRKQILKVKSEIAALENSMPTDYKFVDYDIQKEKRLSYRVWAVWMAWMFVAFETLGALIGAMSNLPLLGMAVFLPFSSFFVVGFVAAIKKIIKNKNYNKVENNKQSQNFEINSHLEAELNAKCEELEKLELLDHSLLTQLKNELMNTNEDYSKFAMKHKLVVRRGDYRNLDEHSEVIDQ